MSAIELIRALTRLTLHNGRGVPRGVERTIVSASTGDWARCLRIVNRLDAPFGGALADSGLTELVPEGPRLRLERARAEQGRRNERRMELFGETLSAWRRFGCDPVVLKSSALVATLYEQQRHNQMGDVDAWIPPELWARATDHLVASGFEPQARQGRPNDFHHPSGELLLDVHHTFELFDHVDLDELTVVAEATAPGIETVRIFEPSAMFAHLVYHLHDHRPGIGFQLCWLLDIGFTVLEWGDRLETGRIRRLLRKDEHLFWVRRTASFLERELGVELPPALRGEARGIEPFTLDEILRSERIARWPLTEPRGWARMAASAMGFRPRGMRKYPLLSDLIGVQRDRRRERRALEQERARSAGPESAVEAPGSGFHEPVPEPVAVTEGSRITG